MLKSLFIQNFVLIDSLDIRFDKGLSVITGETGAGKSIILGALSLVLGQRTDGKSIQSGKEKCIIEAVFDISEYDLASFFAENDMEYDTECIMRRELYASGKSRAFINDSPVSLNQMKDLGSQLIDIHSQHQNLMLSDNRFQLRVVDVMAKNTDLLTDYYRLYTQYQSTKKAYGELASKAMQARQEEDYMRFQLEQLADSKLSVNEQEELEQELELLTHAEEIKGGLLRIVSLLNGEEHSGLLYLKEALSQAGSLERFYPKAKEISQRIREAYIDLNDLASDAESQQEDIEFDPHRQEWVNNRLDLIYSLQQKHHVSTVEGLLEIQADYEAKLQTIDSFDEQLTQLADKQNKIYAELLQLAGKLSKQRRSAAKMIAKQLELMISPLGMPNARFEIAFSDKEEPAADGKDVVNFLFSANKNGELKSVSQTASGGEISRLMLCVKAMIAGNTALPTVIFDEIDAGVSGDVADKMGDIMKDLGGKMQVITITHLPQVAAKGNIHYYVYKEDTKERTLTHIRPLESDERVTEIARMLSGAVLTEAAKANAQELLRQND